MENKNPLEFSLDFEIKGTNLYLDFAKKTKNLLSKRLFYSLAKQEVEHAQLFDEIYRTITNQFRIEEIYFKSKNLDEVESQLKKFFNKARETSFKQKPEDVSEYNLAIEMEKKGIKAYNDFLNQADNEAEKKFFVRLIEEEKKHLEALENVYSYITATGDWLKDEESKTWNWMNI